MKSYEPKKLVLKSTVETNEPKKLVLSKETLRNLSVKTGIKAGTPTATPTADTTATALPRGTRSASRLAHPRRAEPARTSNQPTVASMEA